MVSNFIDVSYVTCNGSEWKEIIRLKTLFWYQTLCLYNIYVATRTQACTYMFQQKQKLIYNYQEKIFAFILKIDIYQFNIFATFF